MLLVRTAATVRPPLIEARNLGKSHQRAGKTSQVLGDVNLTVQEGEFVAIVGPSGSGKTTLLSLLGTLDVPTAGEVLFEGKSTSRLAPDRLAALRNASIGFVFQHFHLLPRTSAIDQVLLPARYAPGGLNRRARAEAERRLDEVGLADYACHTPNQLSGGQQQRVAIARALMNAPKVILADEPTGALDQASGRSILDLLCLLNAKGLTVIIVTHDQAVAQTAWRDIRMQDGRVVHDGPAYAPATVRRALA
jgi:putative ABC transport system ATP-binding protein